MTERRLMPWRDRVAALLLLAGGLLVFWPALRSPLFVDDYFQNAMVHGNYPAPRGPFDLYDFVGDADRSALMDRGLLPWWTDPRLTLRFLRPLSSALLWLDHRVFGDPFACHLHSFVWWAAAVLAARPLYRRGLSRRAALLATIVFGLSPCHVLPLVWLANRNALVSMTLGIVGLGALVRYRERPRARDLAASASCFGLALLGGEHALGFGGYVLARAMTARRSTRPRRLAALAAFAVPAAAYLCARVALGYGTVGSGVYFDPLSDPSEFLQHAPRRLLTLLAQGWLTLDPTMVNEATSRWVLGILTIGGALVLVVPVRRALASLEERGREHATWLLVGSALSLSPVLAVAPAPRLLGVSMLGIAYTVGLVLDRAWFPREPETGSAAGEWTAMVALGLGFAHLVHAPAIARLASHLYRTEAMGYCRRAAAFRAQLRDPASSDVVVVRSFDPGLFVIPWALDASGAPPARWRVLGLGGHVLVSRPDARTLEVVAPEGQSLVPPGENGLFRGEGARFTPGQVVRCGSVRATVLDVNDAGPRRVRFEFESDLESPSRVWLNDRFFGLERAVLPAPGYGAAFDP
jgi:hypothetical protein